MTRTRKNGSTLARRESLKMAPKLRKKKKIYKKKKRSYCFTANGGNLESSTQGRKKKEFDRILEYGHNHIKLTEITVGY